MAADGIRRNQEESEAVGDGHTAPCASMRLCLASRRVRAVFARSICPSATAARSSRPFQFNSRLRRLSFCSSPSKSAAADLCRTPQGEGHRRDQEGSEGLRIHQKPAEASESHHKRSEAIGSNRKQSQAVGSTASPADRSRRD